MPLDKVRTLLDFPVPKTLSNLQQLIGFVSYFSCLLKDSRVLLSPFMDQLKMRDGKPAQFEWTENMNRSFEMIKEKLAKASLEGYNQLLTADKPYGLVSFVDWSGHTSCGAACTFIKDFEEKDLSICYFWSRRLSKTYVNKPPFLCELASLIYFVLSTPEISNFPHLIYTDNLTSFRILNKRLSQVDEWSDSLIHRLLLSVQNRPFKVAYLNGGSIPADYLSRNSEYGEEEELPLPSYSLSDLTELDKKSYTPSNNMWEFMVQTEKKIEAVRSIESKDWDFEAHKVRFSSSHVFSVNREENNSENFLKKWITKPIDPKDLSLVETTKYKKL